jgi:hypothetical protein
LSFSLNSFKVGSELLSFFSSSSNLVEIVTFANELRPGTEKLERVKLSIPYAK